MIGLHEEKHFHKFLVPMWHEVDLDDVLADEEMSFRSNERYGAPTRAEWPRFSPQEIRYHKKLREESAIKRRRNAKKKGGFTKDFVAYPVREVVRSDHERLIEIQEIVRAQNLINREVLIQRNIGRAIANAVRQSAPPAQKEGGVPFKELYGNTA